MAEATTAIPELTTDRLTLRPFTQHDASDVVRLAGVREVSMTIDHLPYPYPLSSALGWISAHAASAEQGKGYTWAISDRGNNSLLGAITLHIDVRHTAGGIGYWIGLPFWNRGYTTEAGRRIIDYAFAVCGLHRLQASCLPSNIGSRRVLV